MSRLVDETKDNLKMVINMRLLWNGYCRRYDTFYTRTVEILPRYEDTSRDTPIEDGKTTTNDSKNIADDSKKANVDEGGNSIEGNLHSLELFILTLLFSEWLREER